MKLLNFKLDDIELYSEALKEADNTKYKDKLIQVFTSETDEENIKNILKKLNDDFNCKIVGSTTAGEILEGKICSNTIISLSLFEKTSIDIKYSEEINYNSGVELSKICNDNTKALLLLSEGLNGEDYEGLILGIEDNKKVLIAGGLAGDNFHLKNTFVFYQNNVYNRGVVAVAFSGENLYVNNKYNLNWIPIGKEFTVTDSNKNIVKEINNRAAKEIFEEYLGEEIFKEESYLLNFQLVYKEGNVSISRTPMKIEGNDIILAGPIKKGQKFQFAFSNSANVFSGIKQIEKDISTNVVEGIYIYSCIARKTLLGDRILESTEFSVLENIAPTSGFFTYGEFFSGEGTNSLLNCTTTILALSEVNNEIQYKNNNEMNITDINFSTLMHFMQKTSKELDENELLLEQYKKIVDYSAIVSKTDKNGAITYVNDNFCKISKYSREELMGKSHNIIKDPNIPNHIFKNMWETILSGEIWKGTLSNRAKDGTIYYVDTTIMPIKQDNKIKEFIAIRFDITSKIKSKQKILEKEKLLRGLLDNQDSIIVYASEDQQIINANKKFLEVFGYENIVEFKKEHSCICDFFLEEEEGYIYPEKYPNWLDDILEKRLDFIPKVKIIINDKIHIFRVKVSKIEGKYIINLDNITDLEEAIEKAYASEKAKSIFLANMSHEIRTPLNGILGFTSILKSKKLDKDVEKYVGIIDRSSKTLLNIVNDILDFSKIESGKVAISPTESEFVTEIKDATLTFSSICKQKNIKYNIYIDEKIPNMLYCDVQRLKQVLNNLISNAVKFTPENGQIDINIELKSIKNNKAHIKFSVKDSGIGIPKNKIKTIFDPFSQADDTIGRKFGGTGLGLAISQEYIRLMGSKIKIKSKENEGSEFYFDLKLPIVENQNSENVEETVDKHYNAKALVAEDDPTNQMLVSILLKERGIKYKMANNGQEAVDCALKEDFDIVFMDITMPILDGLSAIKILKEKGYEKPIISLSANVLEEDRKNFIAAGAVDTLNKPIVPKELDKILEKYIHNDKKSIVSKVFDNVKSIKNSIKDNISDRIDKVKVKYDDISIENIAKQFNIQDLNVVKNLLKSFKSSVNNQIQTIEEKGLNKDILHTIKGLTGNLRLNNVYNLTMKFEKEIDNWDKSKYNSNKKLILEHLKKILEQIDSKLKEK